ncbi:MAG: kinase-like domain-containing protein, partial [Piptocephalis tieghemiana]
LGSGTGGTVRLHAPKLSPSAAPAVAIKHFRARRTNEDQDRYRRRVTQEIELARLGGSSSPYITRVLEVFEEGGNGKWSLVTPFYPRDLFSAVVGRSIGSRLRERIFAELVSAIASLHSLGIAHRDIKLENVCLDGEDHVKLLDFGSATRRPIQSYGLYGSDPYIAPEVIRLDDPRYEGRAYAANIADAWSLGVMWICLWRRSFAWDRATCKDSGFQAFLHHPDRVIGGFGQATDLVRPLLWVDVKERRQVLDLAESPIIAKWLTLRATSRSSSSASSSPKPSSKVPAPPALTVGK